jgi:uroporphyrinogen decarboxylase
MTRWQRVEAALAGERPDRPPLSFWQHFPGRDRTAAGLAQATIAFQQTYDLDLVKLMPTGMYMAQAWGCAIGPGDPQTGTTALVRSVVQDADDWTRLAPLDVRGGVLGEQLAMIRQVRQALGSEVPIIQTIFSPLTTAAKIGDARVTAARRAARVQPESDFAPPESDSGWGHRPRRAAPQQLRRALEVITATTRDFARACLEAGADGFFFATQHASRDVLPRDEFDEWARPFDLQVLDPLAALSRLVVVHAHGDHLFFDSVARYPAQVINWHDRESGPTLREAQTLTDKCLGGGISRAGALVHGTPQQVQAEVRDAMAQTHGRHLFVMPGCVVPLSAPAANLRALRQAIEQG